jgi:hypothetical protein
MHFCIQEKRARELIWQLISSALDATADAT